MARSIQIDPESPSESRLDHFGERTYRRYLPDLEALFERYAGHASAKLRSCVKTAIKVVSADEKLERYFESKPSMEIGGVLFWMSKISYARVRYRS